MAVMLRTQGIATRVVNGFQMGEYNETADVFVVRQMNAHSWVEVYFPARQFGVPFDPTPFAASMGPFHSSLRASERYLKRCKCFWIQYFVAFDNQEQRSLFHFDPPWRFRKLNSRASVWNERIQQRLSEWWKEARGDKGFDIGALAIGFGVLYIGLTFSVVFIFVWLRTENRKIKGLASPSGTLPWKAAGFDRRVLRKDAGGFSKQRLYPAGHQNST